jgi:hypothetical protein
VKKGRHRRFEEARALKRGPDIDIESILDDPFADRDDDDEEEEKDDPADRWSAAEGE